MSIVSDAARIYRRQGIGQLVQSGTVFLGDVLPVRRRPLEYNGVEVLAGWRLSDLLPLSLDRPTYESAIVAGLPEYASPGDSVVVVGGGWGVSSVVAAEAVGPDGIVHTYEGAARQVDRTRETLVHNGVEDRVRVEHAVVGPDIALGGEAGGARNVSPSELPDCDVLVLDCEGAEIPILQGMTAGPSVVIVETHGVFDSPTAAVEETLADLGYEVREKGVADAGKVEFCEEQDVYVLVATKA